MQTDSSFLPIIWGSTFETGVAEMDEHHKLLVSILNEAGMTISEQTNREKLLAISCHLLEYALYHFDQEYHLMQQYGYYEKAAAEAMQHQNEHESFSEWIITFREQLRTDDPLSPTVLVNFVRQWLFEHILNTDKKLGAHITQVNVSKDLQHYP